MISGIQHLYESFDIFEGAYEPEFLPYLPNNIIHDCTYSKRIKLSELYVMYSTQHSR